MAKVQSQLFSKLMQNQVCELEATTPAALSAYFSYDANQLRLAVCDVFLSVGKDTMTVISMIVLMFHEDWSLSLVALATAPVVFFPMRGLGRILRRVSVQTQEEVGRLSGVLNAAFQGITTIKSYGLEEREIQSVTTSIKGWAKLVERAAWIGGAIVPIVDGIGGLAIAAVVVYGGSQVIGHHISPGSLLAFVGAIAGAYAPIPSLSKTNVKLQTGLAAAQRIYALLDKGDASAPVAGGKPEPRLAGPLEFKEVFFKYRDTDVQALNGITFTASIGGTTALIGRAGAGKSTVINLIARFHEPQSGCITIKGIDIRSVAPETLYGSIAIVTQDVLLFDDSIEGNIRVGRASASSDEVHSAALAAGVLDFACRLPTGMSTFIGEGGRTLSVGEKQRISIARALLKDAPILLLDEAMAAQDPEAESGIQRALARLAGGRTTIVVTHRLKTAREADIIYVLDEGKIVEAGSHEELVGRGGLYSDMAAIELSERRNVRGTRIDLAQDALDATV